MSVLLLLYVHIVQLFFHIHKNWRVFCGDLYQAIFTDKRTGFPCAFFFFDKHLHIDSNTCPLNPSTHTHTHTRTHLPDNTSVPSGLVRLWKKKLFCIQAPNRRECKKVNTYYFTADARLFNCIILTVTQLVTQSIHKYTHIVQNLQQSFVEATFDPIKESVSFTAHIQLNMLNLITR